jgi:hypothetical protein
MIQTAENDAQAFARLQASYRAVFLTEDGQAVMRDLCQCYGVDYPTGVERGNAQMSALLEGSKDVIRHIRYLILHNPPVT